MKETDWLAALQAQFPKTDLRHDTFLDEATGLILTSDMLVEGVHFTWQTMTPEALGWKAMVASLSDIAATGGKPQYATISLGAPEPFDAQTAGAVYQGIQSACQTYGVQVAGGDTVRAGQWVLNIHLTGQLAPGSHAGRRHLAQAGDVVAISGPHGLSHGGLIALQQGFSEYTHLIRAHQRPVASVKLGQQMTQVLPRVGMMDSSDGLADAALRLAEASGVDIVLDSACLARHPELEALAKRQLADPLDWVLYGGEDFHLVACLPPEHVGMFPALTVIGRVLPQQHPEQAQAFVLKPDGERYPLSQSQTYQHFQQAPKAL